MQQRPDDHRRGMRISLIGLLVNAALAIVKLVAGLLGHSYALVADAVESMADIFGSLVVWSGLRIGALPADREHPYGHGKAEPLAALIVALLLVAAAIGIAVQAVREILSPHYMPAAYTLWVLLSVVAVKEGLFRIVRRVAGEVKSSAVLLDAWHHRSDAITSAAAAVGISIALIGGQPYAPADDWAALFASGVILFNAYRLSKPPLQELMDAEPSEIIQQVRTVASAVPGVAGVEKVFARKSGMRYWVDMHVEVDPEISVRRAHGIAHQVKDAVRAQVPTVTDVLIHIEPHGQAALDRATP
jgi:cation diffusion facilitator family transporter